MQILKSGISSLYTRPLYPKLGEEVSLYVHALTADVRWVRLAQIDNDNIRRHGMRKVSDDGLYSIYECRIKANAKELRYWFEGELKDGSDVYLTRRGVEHFLCAWEDSFRLVIDLDVPSWTPGTVCYQIFPDRFCNGNPELGARRGDYEFDGHPITEMAWDSKPLSYNEGFCLDFYNGDFDGIISRIDHLKALGVGAVYLNPIGCSRTTHRYDCTDYLHIDPKLGGDEGYVRLIEALHSAGIKVITDISINHTGTDHTWFKAAREGGKEKSYYYSDGHGGFDCWNGVSTLPKLNYGSKALRKVVFEDGDSVLQKFVRAPFRQDGWRIDVATDVGNHNDEHMCHEIWRDIRARLKAIDPEIYIVGEDWDDSSEYLRGDQWDATMNYVGCSRPLRRWMGEKDRFFCRSHNDPDRAPAYSARQLKEHLQRQLGSLSGQMVYQQMNLIDSHDESRLHCDDKVFDKGLYMGAVMMQFMLPGMPCIYYGDEVGLEGPLGSVEDCRYPMVWDRGRWDMELYDLYVALGRLRAEYREVFSQGQWEFGHCDDELLEFRRVTKDRRVVLFMYRGEEGRTVRDIDLKGLRDFFSQREEEYLTLEPRSSRIFVS